MIQTVLKKAQKFGTVFQMAFSQYLNLVHLIQDEKKKIWDHPITSLVWNESALKAGK